MKPVNRNYLTAFIIFLFMCAWSVKGNNPVQKDINGRIILTADGKRINYSKSDPKPAASILKNVRSNYRNNGFGNFYSGKDTVSLEIDNLYTTMGSAIGRNSMHSVDLDNDGIVELISTACSWTYGTGNYWYIMHYDPIDNSCNQIWSSPLLANNISCLEVVDFNNDHKYNIVMGLENGAVELYDAVTKELKKRTVLGYRYISSIEYEDADNDSQKDIVVTSLDYTYILNPVTFELKFTITQGGNSVRIGNVDDDAKNEIVLSTGFVYELDSMDLKTEWFFGNYEDGYVELSDIDHDSKEEIIYAQSWYYIYIYDAEYKTAKHIIHTNLDINALLLTDVNNDGTDEIIYGDGQGGYIHCFDAGTWVEMWTIDNPDAGVAAINYADLDNDGNQELIWSAGWVSSGSDHLYIYALSESKLKWKSADVEGPFHAIAKGDIDQDGKQEIVAFSDASESQYEGSVMLIIDAETHKIKWQSTGEFLNGGLKSIYNVNIQDVDHDGKNEIIIFGYQIIDIIDGKNHTIKSTHQFNTEGITEFYSIAVDDLDDDGNVEFILTSNANLYVIDPKDWSIKWHMDMVFSYASPSILKTGDVNGDGKKEIIACRGGSIQIINSTDHLIWSSQETDYINMDIYDFNNDGILDILACTSYGYIKVMDGQSKSIINNINPEGTSINAVRVFKYNNANVFVYTCDGRINYYLNDSSRLVSQYFDRNIGAFDGLKLFNENDTPTLIVGTDISVLKLSGKMIHCLALNIRPKVTEVSCDKPDGRILLNVTGGIPPYTYNWGDSSDKDSLVNLNEGNYYVTVQDFSGCRKSKSITVEQALISADLQIIQAGCLENGSVHIQINHINDPYTISWSNGQSGIDNNNLPAGSYELHITDSKNCRFEDTAVVEKDTIIMDAHVYQISCYGMNDGAVYLQRLSGALPFTYKWDHGNYQDYARNLREGKYQVVIHDTMGCESALNFDISMPDSMTYRILTDPDDMNSSSWDGRVMINDIAGGTPPYKVYWPKLSVFGDYLNDLPGGIYNFVIWDSKNCFVSDSASIGSLISEIPGIDANAFLIYPNPVVNELVIDSKNTDEPDFSYELFNQHGQIIKNIGPIHDKIEKIDFTGLPSGTYILGLKVNEDLHTMKIVKK
jgi:hypothetical protein